MTDKHKTKGMMEREAIERIQNDLKLHHDDLSGQYRKALRLAISALKKQEQSCETCKHGQFGDEACINCRVGFPNHYEAEEL